MAEWGLTVKELYALNALFADEENQSLEQLAASLNQTFGRKDHLKLGLTVVTMLEQHDLLPRPAQRLVAFYLLYYMYHGELLSQNPFASVFLQLLMTKEPSGDEQADLIGSLPCITKQERFFLVHLLAGGAREYVKKTPKQLMNLDVTQPTATPDLTQLEAAVKETQQASYPRSAKNSFSGVVPIPDNQLAKDISYSEQQAVLKTCEQLFSGPDPRGFHSFRPSFLRLAPPLHVGEDEFVWLDPSDCAEFVPIWDESMCSSRKESEGASTTSVQAASAEAEESTSTLEEEEKEWDAVQMLQKAMTSQLLMTESNWLVERIREDGSLVGKVGMCPDKLPGLVEANPLIAVEVILKLLNSKEISAYFEVLICMDLSVHGMEVVNRLTSHVEMPQEFLHVYVSNCISACEQMKENSLSQNRLVRLVCVFLQALIRNRVICVQDLHIELQAFCINFSRIREAAALFRVVQNIHSDQHLEDDPRANADFS